MASRMDDQNMKVALGNLLVLDMVLSKLVLSNLKSCRLVSSKWNELSKKHVNRLSVCKICNHILGANNDLKSFNRDFVSPSSHIRLKNFHLFVGQFSVRELETFFNDWAFIQELTLDSVTVKDDSGGSLDKYNISSILTAFDNLSVLNIVCLRKTTIVVPLSYVARVKSLSLKYCWIVFDARIAPTKLIAQFYRGLQRNGEPFKRSGPILNLNEFVDITYLKELTFSSHFYDQTLFRLDLTDCLRLEYVAVGWTEVIGWNNTNLSSLSRAYISDVPLDLSDLPPSPLVDLDISDVTDLKNSANIQLINLKQLAFSKQQQFSFFTHCPNLEHLRIKNNNFDLDSLPTSVRSMTIRGVFEFVGGGGRDVQLDKLVFNDFACTDNNWEGIQKAIERVNPATVVLSLVCNLLSGSTCTGDLSILSGIVQKQMKKGGKFVLKLWGCKSKRLLAIPFKGCAPEGGFCDECHIYENEFGRMIPETDYERWFGLPNELPLRAWHGGY